MATLELQALAATLSVPPWLWAALGVLTVVALLSLRKMLEHFAFVWRSPAHDDAAIRLIRGVRRLVFVACSVIFGFALVQQSDTLWLTGTIILGEELYETGGGLLILRWVKADRAARAARALEAA